MAKSMRAWALVAVVSMALAGCSASGDEKTVSMDLPTGDAAHSAKLTKDAVQLYLDQIGGKAGKYSVRVTQHEVDPSAEGACRSAAEGHAGAEDELAVLSAYPAGCAEAALPVLNQAPGGPLVAVSYANTSGDLTESGSSMIGKLYPTGKRNFARVVTTDDVAGRAMGAFVARQLGAARVVVLDDGRPSGRALAKSVADGATRAGAVVVGTASWDPKSSDATAVMTGLKAARPMAVVLAGDPGSAGTALIKAKRAVLGDNQTVRLMASSGFAGRAELATLPEAQGMYLAANAPSLDRLVAASPPAAKLVEAFKAAHGGLAPDGQAVLGVAALQVVLEAVEKSDGTRNGVRDALFAGSGITVPAARSVLGRDTAIDPKTGDVTMRDVSVQLVRNNQGSFFALASAG